MAEARHSDQGILIVLCGPAGSGKSRWAQDRYPAPAIVSSDDCRERIGDDPADQSVSPGAFSLFRMILRLRLAAGRPAVADSTALEPATRRVLMDIAREAGVEAVLVLMDMPIELCRERNRGRDRQVPEVILVRHAGQMKAALAEVGEEGWDRIVRFTTPEEAEGSGPLTRS